MEIKHHGSRENRAAHCKEIRLQRKRDKYNENSEFYIKKADNWNRANPEKYRENARNYYQTVKSIRKSDYTQTKLKVLLFYSQGRLECACCKVTERAFLCLDHINGGGTRERKEGGGATRLYYRLVSEGYPPGYQVLCWNCNSAKHYSGKCPHQNKVGFYIV